ncbi:MAG: acetate--CoA ligase [Acidimicrobiales bacterium]
MSTTAANAEFWDHARQQLAGLPGGGVNIAHEAVTRHATDPQRADRPALRFARRDGSTQTWTYAEFETRSNQAAHALARLGVRRGDRVFTALGRVPELYQSAIATWKLGAVFCPMFAAFGPEPLHQRLSIGRGQVLITTSAIHRGRIEPQRSQLPDLRHVLCVDPPPTNAPGALDFHEHCDGAPADPAMAATGPSDPAIIHFTSGTTGTPKGALHVHEAVVAHRATAITALGLRPDDVVWCTADPGWVTGTSYGIIAPLSLGATMVVDEGEFDAERWYELLVRERVNVWYTAPTAIRMLMRVGTEVAHAHTNQYGQFPDLRFIASVGEPLAASAVQWGVEALGQPIHDNWWQTETGGIMVANGPDEDVVPGSMGRPLPGVAAGVLSVDDDGNVRLDAQGGAIELGPGETGMLALRPGWPSQFRAYLDQTERYAACFSADGRWYLSGDLVSWDHSGHLFFVGRADDVIKSAGHLIGPFEVEQVLVAHPKVSAAGVFGKPDALAGAIVKAVVVPKAGIEPDDALRRELMAHARRQLGPAVAPREIAFAESLPQTRSGKILRRVLKARELGLPEGDLSTLEPAPTAAPAVAP